MAFLAAFTITSWAPSKCEAPCGLNLHVSPSSAVLLWRCRRSNWLASFFNSPTASTHYASVAYHFLRNSTATSETGEGVWERVGIKSPGHLLMHCSSFQASKKAQPPLLSWFPCPWTVYKGPAKSTVVWAKGLKLKRSLVFGSGAIIWQAGLLRLLLHSLHS